MLCREIAVFVRGYMPTWMSHGAWAVWWQLARRVFFYGAKLLVVSPLPPVTDKVTVHYNIQPIILLCHLQRFNFHKLNKVKVAGVACKSLAPFSLLGYISEASQGSHVPYCEYRPQIRKSSLRHRLWLVVMCWLCAASQTDESTNLFAVCGLTLGSDICHREVEDL